MAKDVSFETTLISQGLGKVYTRLANRVFMLVLIISVYHGGNLLLQIGQVPNFRIDRDIQGPIVHTSPLQYAYQRVC